MKIHMRLLKLNPLLLALIFSVFIEGLGILVYWCIALLYGTGTVTDFWYFWFDSLSFVHRPAVELTRFLYTGGHRPGTGLHLLFETCDLFVWWLISLVGILIFRLVFKKNDEGKRKAR